MDLPDRRADSLGRSALAWLTPPEEGAGLRTEEVKGVGPFGAPPLSPPLAEAFLFAPSPERDLGRGMASRTFMDELRFAPLSLTAGVEAGEADLELADLLRDGRAREVLMATIVEE